MKRGVKGERKEFRREDSSFNQRHFMDENGENHQLRDRGRKNRRGSQERERERER